MVVLSDYRYILYQYVTTSIGVLAIIFNLLEIVYIRYSRYSQRNPIGYVYMTNIALSDLFVGVIMVILKSMHPFMKTTLKDNEFAEELYDLIRFCFIRFSLLVSVFNLIALTVDRVMAIRYPFRHRQRDTSFPRKVCVAVWIASLALLSIFYGITHFYLQSSERYRDIVFPIATYPATILFIVCYWMILDVVKKTARIEGKNTIRVKLNNVSSEGNNSRDEQELKTEEHNRNSAEVKFARLATKTVVAFAMCWLPISTVSILKLYDKHLIGIDFESSMFTLAILNSIVTPFVYFSHLQEAIKSTFRRLFSRIFPENEK